ncbi:MAG: hypothetical protein R2856_37650 [Caldilineaceae bacterium]
MPSRTPHPGGGRTGKRPSPPCFGPSSSAATLWYSTANNLGPLEAVRQLLDLFRTSAVGPLIYLAIYMVRPLIFFSAAVLTLAAGFVFWAGVGRHLRHAGRQPVGVARLLHRLLLRRRRPRR